MNNSNLEYALHYASLGIPVLPLHYIDIDGRCSCGGPEVKPKCKPGKHPYSTLVPRGLNDATIDDATIRKWFAGKPYNIGINTGVASGFFALDRDDRDGGDQSLAELEAKYTPLPPTLAQRTGNGVHYLFKMPQGREVRNSTKKIARGLDIRGTGGYICAAPSRHANGHKYTWEGASLLTRERIAPAPQWLLTVLDSNEKSAAKFSTVANAFTPTDDFAWPDRIEDGEGREDFILRAAGHLRGNGLCQSEIERILLDYNHIHIAPPLEPDAVRDRARRYQHVLPMEAPNGSDWPEPSDIKATLPPVPLFDDRLLPPAFRAWVKDLAERMQCPIEFLAVGAMVAAGAVIGNRVGVQPKQHDTGWIEVPNLWGAVVGRPGVMKSPALAQVLAPLKRLEAEALSNFASIRAQFEIDRMQFEATKKQVEASIKKGATVLPSQFPLQPEEPQPPRLLLNDATYQKLGQVLSGNPHGVLVFQDELSGLMVRLDADGQEAARAFYLEAWNGLQPYTFDRIERGTIRIPRLCLSLMGGMQPSKLREYLRGAVYGGKSDDGLAQRLQLLVYPDISTHWQRIDRHPDIAAAAAVNAVFDQLASLDLAALGARMPLNEGIPVFCFSNEAQGLFNAWWEQFEKSMRQDEQHPALESHMSKYRKLVPALALIHHLIAGTSGGISGQSLACAIKWQQFLLAHARRAYAAVTSATMSSAKALSHHILRGALPNGFTARDVYRHNWSLLSNVKEATEAVEVLVDLGWLRPVQDKRQNDTYGRPSVRYYINPSLKVVT